MSNENRFRGFALAVAASAIALTVIAQSAKADPLPGTCKILTQTAVAPSPELAQQAWVQSVASKFGPKWANWVGAKNKAIYPISNYYQAMGKPCFYQPVT